MRLTFVGHACALLEFSGCRVLTDPYSPVIGGYRAVDLDADLVTISHSNPKWHSCLDDVQGAFSLYDGLSHLGKTTEMKGVELEAIRVFERLHPGRDESESQGGDGPNAMIKIVGDGVRVLHMGDGGHALSDATVAACGEVDVLLVPAGGAPTIDLDDVLRLVSALRPPLVVPIHYGVPGLGMALRPVDALAEKWNVGPVVPSADSSFDARHPPAGVGSAPQLHLLKPLRLIEEF